jgi:hypothetical protein
MKSIFFYSLLLIFGITFNGQAAELPDSISKDDTTQKILSESDINIKHSSKNRIYGLLNFKPVLSGVLYRGGSGGKAHLAKAYLNNDQLKALCQAGFSTAVFAYGVGTSPIGNPIQCTMLDGRSNTLAYINNNFKNKKEFVKLVSDIIRDHKGPIFEHCQGGNHASGELAALSLKQFCSFSAAKTLTYWENNITNPAGGNAPGIRAMNFDPISSFALDAESFNKVCPK